VATVFCSSKCWGANKKKDVEERFWSKVQKTDTCWLWTGGLFDSGYGAFGISSGHNLYAHRYAYTLTNGPIPTGKIVCHTCDVNYAPGDITYRRCVRWDHLALGTWASNIQHAYDCGRLIPGPLPHGGGEKHPGCKLSDARLAEMRERWAKGNMSIVAIAELFGISDCHAGRLLHGTVRPSE
jgi:hypothetical protein